MDMISRYRQFAEKIDLCSDIQQLQQFQNTSSISSMQKEFWKQRQLAASAPTPLEKQQAAAKLQWLQHFFGCNIANRRSIKRFTAPNGLFGIFIAPEAAVDEGCVIFQQVFIGGNTLAEGTNTGFPVIGKNVYIGAGAKITGGVVIGDNARIEANCHINFDVPQYAHVVSTDSQVIRMDTPSDNTLLSTQEYLNRYFDRPTAECLDNSNLTVHKATPDDMDSIVRLYKDRINWFRWKKISQWTFYLVHHPPEEFMHSIINGCYYVIKDGDSVVAGFVVSDESENWNDTHSNACYLSRAVAHTAYRHMGNVIAAKAREIALQSGRDYLRLECVYGNELLNGIWEKQGFEFVRDVQGSYHASLRQMDLRPAEIISAEKAALAQALAEQQAEEPKEQVTETTAETVLTEEITAEEAATETAEAETTE